MDAHSGFPVHFNKSDTFSFFKVDKPFTLVQCECMLEYEHLIRHHPGADSAARTGETWTAHVDICL